MSNQRPSEGRMRCFPAIAPVLTVINRNVPSVYQVIAFGFDIYNTPVKVPVELINTMNKSSEKADATAQSWLKPFKEVLSYNIKKSVGNVPVKVEEVYNVFGPLCDTAYVVLRVTGTPGVRAVIEPAVISSSYDQASQYVSAVVVSSIRSRATATSYTIVQAPVQFFLTPDQVSSYMNAITRSG